MASLSATLRSSAPGSAASALAASGAPVAGALADAGMQRITISMDSFDSEVSRRMSVDRGVVNILVGFAPLKPAEFVVIKIEQMAGQVQAG